MKELNKNAANSIYFLYQCGIHFLKRVAIASFFGGLMATLVFMGDTDISFVDMLLQLYFYELLMIYTFMVVAVIYFFLGIRSIIDYVNKYKTK